MFILGVGKTALADRISSIGMKFFTWTIGCSVTVKLHPYKQGTPDEGTFFIELYDVGGSNHHKESRSVFYQSTQGLIIHIFIIIYSVYLELHIASR